MVDASSPYRSLGYFRKIHFYSLPRYSKRSLIFHRQEKNRLLTVARVLSATQADSTGKIETKAQGIYSYCKGNLILNGLSSSSARKE